MKAKTITPLKRLKTSEKKWDLFKKIPLEVIEHILLQLPPIELFNLMLVSNSFQQWVTQNNKLWGRFYEKLPLGEAVFQSALRDFTFLSVYNQGIFNRTVRGELDIDKAIWILNWLHQVKEAPESINLDVRKDYLKESLLSLNLIKPGDFPGFRYCGEYIKKEIVEFIELLLRSKDGISTLVDLNLFALPDLIKDPQDNLWILSPQATLMKFLPLLISKLPIPMEKFPHREIPEPHFHLEKKETLETFKENIKLLEIYNIGPHQLFMDKTIRDIGSKPVYMRPKLDLILRALKWGLKPSDVSWEQIVAMNWDSLFILFGKDEDAEKGVKLLREVKGVREAILSKDKQNKNSNLKFILKSFDKMVEYFQYMHAGLMKIPTNKLKILVNEGYLILFKENKLILEESGKLFVSGNFSDDLCYKINFRKELDALLPPVDSSNSVGLSSNRHTFFPGLPTDISGHKENNKSNPKEEDNEENNKKEPEFHG